MFNSKYILKKRISKISLCFVFLISILIIRCYYVQNKYSPVAGSEDNNSIEKEHISDYNYLLLDRNGKDLNNYKRMYRVIIDGQTFSTNTMNQNLDNFISFNYILKEEIEDFDTNEIIKKEIRKSYDISKEAYDKIMKLEGVKGIYAYEYDEKNNIDNWSIESMVVKEMARNGYDNIDNFKKDVNSLEGQIISYTKNNKNTNVVFEKDINGIYKQVGYEVSDQNNNITLTLDQKYQEIIRDVLAREEYKKYENVGVALVKSRTGEVLGLAQKNEDIANIVTGGGCIDGYDPGSTFKILTLEAAMNFNNVKLSDEYVCSGKICKSHLVHGKINVQKAMEVSCNDIFATLSAEVGYERLQNYASTQGFFNSVLDLDYKTGMEAIGKRGSSESQGLIGIGQGISTTPMQVVASMSTVVNEGLYTEPYLLKAVEDNTGKIVKEFEAEKNKVLDENTANTIKYLLRDCVTNGTGKNAYIEGVEIGGKTGTTESNKDSSHGWFAGYFKLDGEYYNMVVFVPNIEGKGDEGSELSGGNTAAPIFKEIILEIIKNDLNS